MALSDLSIRARMDKGEIIIHPFNASDMGSAQYDLRLGKYFYEAQRRPHLRLFYNIYSQHSVRKVWGCYKVAIPAHKWMERYPNEDWDNIREDDDIIMLGPHSNLLCHTYEFIGAKINATTMMKARSSIGRSLVNVCQCAGMGDIGYFNRWTMEIYNRDEYYIPLVVHRRISQLIFMDTGASEKTYLSKYQGTDDLDKLVHDWGPQMMLPRLDTDRDITHRFIPIEYLNNGVYC